VEANKNHQQQPVLFRSLMNKARSELLGGRRHWFQRETVVLRQENVHPQSAQVTKQTLVEMGWEILLHPAKSLDLVPSDFHLFDPMKETLRGKHLGDNDKA
jgi:hypothetical protein